MEKQKLKDKYLEYFDECWEFSVGDGWAVLIETICEKIKNYELNLRDRLERAERLKDDASVKYDWASEIPALKEQVKLLEENPFKWLQIKEKFAGGRFYYTGGNSEIAHWIDFAESLSYNICERDGRRVTHKSTKRWMVRMCDKCVENFDESYGVVKIEEEI